MLAMAHEPQTDSHSSSEVTNLTRREILQRASLAVAAAALPVAAEAASPQQGAFKPPAGPDQPIGEVMTTLSAYMSRARDQALPPKALEQAKWHILDTIAAMVSGSELPAGRAATLFARAYGGEKVATIVADTIVCGPFEAALVNGTLAHADETDDSWPGGWHPGAGVVPAALAAGISGAHFVRAVAVGYDLGARMLITIRPGLPDSHKGTHAISGQRAACGAAACAASLSPQQMRWAMDYTAQQCSGIASWFRDRDHIEKGFVYGGMPARSGVTSALLVRAGL